VEDVEAVAGRWRDSAQYDARYDVALDVVINILDIMTVVAHVGEGCP